MFGIGRSGGRRKKLLLGRAGRQKGVAGAAQACERIAMDAVTPCYRGEWHSVGNHFFDRVAVNAYLSHFLRMAAGAAKLDPCGSFGGTYLRCEKAYDFHTVFDSV